MAMNDTLGRGQDGSSVEGRGVFLIVVDGWVKLIINTKWKHWLGNNWFEMIDIAQTHVISSSLTAPEPT
jgi:hypothetical protein